MVKNSMLIVGLDLGDRCSYLTILDQDGELIEESRLPTTKVSMQGKFSNLQPCRVAMEVGAHSRWASQLLKDLGHDVLVANARKLRAIYHNPRKGDRADAETLARLARLDPALLSPIHHRSPQAQADLAVLRSRDAVVRSRTLLINHARDIVKASGSRLPSCSADSFAHKVAPDIPESLRPALAPILDTIASLGAGRWGQPSVLSLVEINPVIKTLSCGSRGPETPTCVACSLDPLNTSWGLLGRIATCAVGD